MNGFDTTQSNDVWGSIGRAVEAGISGISDATAAVIRARATPSGTVQTYQRNPLPGTSGTYPQAEVKPGAESAGLLGFNSKLTPTTMLMMVGGAILFMLLLRR